MVGTPASDVGARAGVSATTVFRVFTDDRHVLPDTRARVRAPVRALRHVPNTLARTVRSERDPVLGVAVPDLADSLSSQPSPLGRAHGRGAAPRDRTGRWCGWPGCMSVVLAGGPVLPGDVVEVDVPETADGPLEPV